MTYTTNKTDKTACYTPPSSRAVLLIDSSYNRQVLPACEFKTKLIIQSIRGHVMAAKVLLFARQNANQRTKCSPKRRRVISERVIYVRCLFKNFNFCCLILQFNFVCNCIVIYVRWVMVGVESLTGRFATL